MEDTYLSLQNLLSSEIVKSSAHQRLSACQRAALAVNVFWALNTSRAKIPKILIMDEPVQNIDELNALNFLTVCDGWLKAAAVRSFCQHQVGDWLDW